METLTPTGSPLFPSLTESVCSAPPTSPSSSTASAASQTLIFIRSKAFTAAEFLSTYTPERQTYYCANEESCVLGDYPTLQALAKAFTAKSVNQWLCIHLHELSEYCGVRERLKDFQMAFLAQDILTNYFFLKVSEIMLFFIRFKQGRYGRLYGSVDPMVIKRGLNTFIQDRGDVIAAHEHEEARRKAEELRRSPRAKTFRKMIEGGWQPKSSFLRAEAERMATQDGEKGRN